MSTRAAGIGEVRPARRAGLTVELLDGFRACAGVQELALPLSAQRVLVFLGIHDRPLLRVHVASSLWLDCTEERALASMRTALWRLPATGLVEATATHVGIGRGVALDVRRQQEAIARVSAGGALERRDVEELARAGDLMPDWYDDWLIMRREQLRQERLQALEHACERLVDLGRFGEATCAGLAAARAEPLRESAHRALIRLHLARGNRSDALHQYELFARLLRSQLGLEPSPAMEALICQARPRVTVG